MLFLRELDDCTYTLYDIEMMHQILEIRAYNHAPEPEVPQYNT